MIGRSLSGALAVLLAMTSPATAQPLSPDVRLERARVCAAALDLACAETELSAARPVADSLPAGQQVDLWRLSAELALATSREADARDYLRRLLALDPEWRPDPDAWAPTWVAVLEDVRRAAPDVRPPELAVQAPKTAIAGAPLTVTVSATDRSGVAGVTLFIGAGDAFPMATTDGETWQVAIPAELVLAGELRLWIEATDRAGNGPARWGSAEMPRLCAVTDPAPPIADPLTTATIEPPPEADTPVWETWWFWTTIGVGVAGVGTLVYFLVPRSSGPPPDDAADLSVEVRWAR